MRDQRSWPPMAGSSAAFDDVVTYPESWVGLDQLAAFPYRPTFRYEGDTINAKHRRIAEAPGGRLGLAYLIDLGIDGFLLRADAPKLYELAYFVPGDVLELGTHKGLSTSILAGALADRGHGRIETVDIDADASAIARANLRARPGAERVTFTLADAADRMDQLIAAGASFGFVFVDHWHGYDATLAVVKRAKTLLAPGGFILFHDFLDPGNADPAHPHGVFQAVVDGFGADDRFAFCGNFGCCGLFRRSRARCTAPTNA